MNKIIEVDPELCTALVEPGVTYQQLYDYLKENNLPLWLSCSGTVGHRRPAGQHAGPRRGLHAVWRAFHDAVRHGSRARQRRRAAHRHGRRGKVEHLAGLQVGLRPYLDGIFTQSNYGIVTKMGFWLMPEPPVFKPFAIRSRTTTTSPNRRDAASAAHRQDHPERRRHRQVLWEARPSSRRSDYYDGPA